MSKNVSKERVLARRQRHRRVRTKIFGTAQCPRLNVFRSLSHIQAQIIDDERGHTLVAASSVEPGLRGELVGLGKSAQAKIVGQVLGERAQAKGVQQVVFDRGGYKYHGRVKALADGAREAGLKF